MTTIEYKMKPYSIRSLMYWNGFTKIEDGVYTKEKLSNGFRNILIDANNFHEGIKVTFESNVFGYWRKESKILHKGTNWHDEVYPELLIFLITIMDNMKIPNFDKRKSL